MSESELLTEILSLQERGNYIQQWWASMSFGLIGVAHFGRKNLNLALVTLLLLVYVFFTINMATQLASALFPIGGFLDDLEKLQATGSVSIGTTMVLERIGGQPWNRITYPVSQIGLFVGCISYLIYMYRESRINNKLRNGASDT